MEKLRFIADTDWQSNVDGRPFLFKLRLLYILLTFFPFIKLDAVTVRVISDFSLITSVGGSSDVKGYKLIPEAFPLMIKLPFSQFIRAFLFVLFLMVIFHALLSGVKRKIIPSWVYSNFPAWFACDENEILHCVLSIYCAYDNTG